MIKKHKIDEILEFSQSSYLKDEKEFFKNRNFKKIREELMYVALFLKGYKKFFSKEYYLIENENPDCIVVNIDDENDRYGFEVMVLNDYNLPDDINWSNVADFIFEKKGLNNYGNNCFLLIPVFKEGSNCVDISLLLRKISEYKKDKNAFNYSDIFIIFWKGFKSLQVISLFKEVNDNNYRLDHY